MANQRGIVSGWDKTNNRPKGVVPPADMRSSLASLARAEGIMLEPGAATVTRPSTAMAIRWTSFLAVIASPLGGWLCPRVGAGQIALQAGHSTYDRIDVVWVRQWDYEVSGDHPDSEVQVGVATGTAAASPSAPAVPSGALAVFTVRVPRGATVGSDIPAANVSRCRWTTPVGGILTAASQAEADALVAGVPASAEAPVYATIGGLLSAWNGSAWGAVGAAPVGALMPFAGAAAPIGWLLCHGQTLQSADYPALFQTIGYRYGGSGSAFQLPDMRGRVPAGVGAGSFASLGQQVGSETHTLTADQMPSHSHVVYETGRGVELGMWASNVGGGSGWQVVSSSLAGEAGHIRTRPAGSGQPHPIVQPSIALEFIIRAS